MTATTTLPATPPAGCKLLKLVVPNDNNKLACNLFSVINYAPKRLIGKEEFGNVYEIKQDDGSCVYVHCIKIQRLSFIGIADENTMPATGMDEFTFKAQWMEKHPDTVHTTPMAIYYYQVIAKTPAV
jgi:hypothetical protein